MDKKDKGKKLFTKSIPLLQMHNQQHDTYRKVNTHFENENQWNIKQFFLIGNSYHNTSIRKIMENHILKNTSIKTMISSLKTAYVGNLKRQ